MKIVVIQSVAESDPGLESHVQALCDWLVASDHEVERIDLPRFADIEHALSTAASHRLMDLVDIADRVICLDPIAAIVAHPRKTVWLLEEGELQHLQRRHENASPANVYLAKVLAAGLKEACDCFAPSSYAEARLADLSIRTLGVLEVEQSLTTSLIERRPGLELLLLSPIDVNHRPGLLVDCLDELPSEIRARWIAPASNPAVLSSLRRLIEMRGLSQRVAIDLRRIEDGELRYFLGNALALLDLGEGSFVVPGHVTQALAGGVPVIAMADGGALAEAVSRAVEPTGVKLAEAIRQVGTCELAHRKPKKTTGWTPLSKVLSA